MKDKKKTILVVDDEPDIQLFLSTVLEDAGFNVMTADNGKHALEKISDHTPDLISLDLVMPKMGGVKLLSYLQKNPEWAKIPFIIVTAHAHDEMGKEDLTKLKAEKVLVGPHSYIEKPIVPSEYIKKVRESLGLNVVGNSDANDLRTKIQDKLRTASKEALEQALKKLAD
ncbi:MAG: response regulator [Thermodesulfobacteriota bacterium]|nr:response regulator [Thermodesulfobacteriota bacterium]